MTGWSPRDTATLVQNKHGPDSRIRAEPSLASLGERINFAVFHYSEVCRVHRTVKANAIDGRDPYDLVLSETLETERAILHRGQDEISAHAIAAAQSMHALPDILAHAVYYCLAVDQSTAAIRNPRVINHQSVLHALKAISSMRADVVDVFEQVTTPDDYRYLAALVNESKHRSVTRSGFQFDATGREPEPYWLQFAGFVRRGKPIAARQVEPFLRTEIERLSSAIVATGHALNRALQ